MDYYFRNCYNRSNFAPKENENYMSYNCYDKSIYKCGKCRKRCKWHDIAKKAEQLIDNIEEEK